MNTNLIGEFLQETEEALKLIFDAIRTENLLHLNLAAAITSKIPALTKNCQLCGSGYSETIKTEIGNRFEKIAINLDRLVSIFKDKIDKHILFSEKALQELEYLIGTTKHLARCLRDAVNTKNDILSKYIIKTANAMENTAANFALEHEERLAGGICQPQASTVFIDLLVVLKENSYHIKEIGRQISFLDRNNKK